MKKVLLVLVVALCCSSCGCGLYNWCDYEKTSFNYYKKQTPQTMGLLMLTYQTMINNQQHSKRKVVPPGIHAEFGYLLLKKGCKTEGIEQLNEEMDLYPESKTFISRIVKLAEQ